MPDPSREERDAIERYAARLGVHLSARQVSQLHGYLELLDTWNRRFRLVGTRDRSALITRHIVDALGAAPLVVSRSLIIDIGSGAGLPGIPVAIACPDASVTLLESRRRPVSFLTETARSLALANVRVLETRVETVIGGSGQMGGFDAALARAWEGLERFLEVSAALLRPGGIAIAMKGPRADKEIGALGDVARTFGPPHKVPYTIEGARARVLLVFERV